MYPNNNGKRRILLVWPEAPPQILIEKIQELFCGGVEVRHEKLHDPNPTYLCQRVRENCFQELILFPLFDHLQETVASLLQRGLRPLQPVLEAVASKRHGHFLYRGNFYELTGEFNRARLRVDWERWGRAA